MTFLLNQVFGYALVALIALISCWWGVVGIMRGARNIQTQSAMGKFSGVLQLAGGAIFAAATLVGVWLVLTGNKPPS